MLKRYDLPACPVETALLLMGDRYKILIVRELLTETKRFGQLKKAINGISQKVLTQHLRIMEEHELLIRKVFAEVPPRVEYSLTEFGKSLKPILVAMREWGENYQASQLTGNSFAGQTTCSFSSKPSIDILSAKSAISSPFVGLSLLSYTCKPKTELMLTILPLFHATSMA